MLLYDKDQHILLRDEAHKRRICKPGEWDTFLKRVPEADYMPHKPGERMTVFEVEIPDWPPAPRSPLQLMMSLDGGVPTGPFHDKPWTGRQPVVERNFWTQRAVSRLAREIVPNNQNYEPERLAYQWQAPLFDTNYHVLIRPFCQEHGIDIVDFWKKIQPSLPSLEIVTTVNPHIKEERAKGGYSPTRRCILVEQQHLILGPPEGEAGSGGKESILPLADGTYTRGAIEAALVRKCGRPVEFFTNRMSDSRIVPMPNLETLIDFLKSDPTDGLLYVYDRGEKNYDCENFSDTLRVALNMKLGLNSCGVMWGDTHAFCVFIVAGESEPIIVFVEPQRDLIVDKLEGQYSVKNICGVYI